VTDGHPSNRKKEQVAKEMFTLGIEIDGDLSSEKRRRILSHLEASLRAVAIPNEDLKVASPSEDYFSHSHSHAPEENGAACKTCKQIAMVEVINP
jgi:hypothetical protein